jgi:hypothetical protein
MELAEHREGHGLDVDGRSTSRTSTTSSTSGWRNRLRSGPCWTTPGTTGADSTALRSCSPGPAPSTTSIVKGYGGNLIPPILAAGPHHLYAADNRFADVHGDDGVPEYAIGRLPVLTPGRAPRKLSRRCKDLRKRLRPLEDALFAADDPDQHGPLPFGQQRSGLADRRRPPTRKKPISPTTAVGEARQLVPSTEPRRGCRPLQLPRPRRPGLPGAREPAHRRRTSRRLDER